MLRDMSYEERVLKIGLTTKKEKRNRGDVNMLYKSVIGKVIDG